MQMFFTSGTTGSPKMTEITSACYGLGHSITAKYWMDLCPTDVHWNISDTGWAKSAWSNVFSPWINGSCVFIHAMPRIDPPAILQVRSDTPYFIIQYFLLHRVRETKPPIFGSNFDKS